VTRDATTDLAGVSRRLQAGIEPLLRNVPLEEKLEQITAATLGSVPGLDGYGLALIEGEEVVAAVSSTGLVSSLHDLERSLGEGPCWDTLHDGQPTSVLEALGPGHRDGEPRSYRTEAGGLGVRSQAAVRIRPHKRTMGALTIVSTTSDEVPLDLETLGVTVGLLALALDQAQLRAGIEDGLRGRTVIGQALGIVMERYRMTEELALSYLKRESSTQNRKLRDIAEEIVATRP